MWKSKKGRIRTAWQELERNEGDISAIQQITGWCGCHRLMCYVQNKSEISSITGDFIVKLLYTVNRLPNLRHTQYLQYHCHFNGHFQVNLGSSVPTGFLHLLITNRLSSRICRTGFYGWISFPSPCKQCQSTSTNLIIFPTFMTFLKSVTASHYHWTHF